MPISFGFNLETKPRAQANTQSSEFDDTFAEVLEAFEVDGRRTPLSEVSPPIQWIDPQLTFELATFLAANRDLMTSSEIASELLASVNGPTTYEELRALLSSGEAYGAVTARMRFFLEHTISRVRVTGGTVHRVERELWCIQFLYDCAFIGPSKALAKPLRLIVPNRRSKRRVAADLREPVALADTGSQLKNIADQLSTIGRASLARKQLGETPPQISSARRSLFRGKVLKKVAQAVIEPVSSLSPIRRSLFDEFDFNREPHSPTLGEVDAGLQADVAQLLALDRVGGMTIGTATHALDDVVSSGLRQLASAPSSDSDSTIRLQFADISIHVPLFQLQPMTAYEGRVEVEGFSDHIVVERDVVGYEPAEILRIDPIRARERWLTSRENYTEQTSSSTESIRELSDDRTEFGVSTRNDFETSVRTEIASRIGVEGSVDAQFGGLSVKVNTHLGASYERTRQQVDEVVERTVRDVSEKTTSRQLSDTMRTETITNVETERLLTDREILPADQDANRIFQAVDEVSRLTAFNRGRRLKLRCTVENPAQTLVQLHAALFPDVSLPAPPQISIVSDNRNFDDLTREQILELLENVASGGAGVSKIPLRPEHLGPENYLAIAAQYGATETIPKYPEPETLVAGHSELPKAPTSHGVPNTQLSVQIPDGYYPAFVGVSGVHVPHGYYVNGIKRTGYLSVNCAGIKVNFRSGDTPNFLPAWMDLSQATGTTHPGASGLVTPEGATASTIGGVLPIDVGWFRAAIVSLSIAVECRPRQSTVLQWQSAAFETIMQAYRDRVSEAEESARLRELSGPLVEQHPEIIRQRIHTELKRSFIEALIGSNLGLDSYEIGQTTIDSDDPDALGALMSWIEDSIEWKFLSAKYSDYFWSARLGWLDRLSRDFGNRELNEMALASHAVLEVTVNPSFEDDVLYFLSYGSLWEDSTAPIAGVEDQNILDQLPINAQWSDEHKLAVSLNPSSRDAFVVSTDGSPLLMQQLIGARFRISSSDGTHDVGRFRTVAPDGSATLDTDWSGQIAKKVPFELGPVIVGRPVLVRSPTSHPWLRPQQTLPNLDSERISMV